MPEKTIYDVARGFDEALARDERSTLLRLTAAYGEVWKGLKLELDAHLKRMAEAQSAGFPPTPAAIRTDARLRALLEQVEERIQAWARDVAGAAEALQAIGVDLGQRYTQGVLGLSLGQHARVLGVFDRLSASAIQAMVGFTSDGSPLADLFATLGADVRAAWERLLIAGIAIGRAPDEVARLARRETGQALWRATRIARTEMLRAYREAAHQTALKNEAVLRGWVWMSALDVRTCASCFAMHGTEHPLEERLDDHPNGRCVAVPQTKTWAELGLDGVPGRRPVMPDAEERLRSLTREQQDAILGKTAAEMWRDGKIALHEFTEQRSDPRWGTMRSHKPLERILADKERRWERLHQGDIDGVANVLRHAGFNVQWAGRVKYERALDGTGMAALFDAYPGRLSDGRLTRGERYVLVPATTFEEVGRKDPGALVMMLHEAIHAASDGLTRQNYLDHQWFEEMPAEVLTAKYARAMLADAGLEGISIEALSWRAGKVKTMYARFLEVGLRQWEVDAMLARMWRHQLPWRREALAFEISDALQLTISAAKEFVEALIR